MHLLKCVSFFLNSKSYPKILNMHISTPLDLSAPTAFCSTLVLDTNMGRLLAQLYPCLMLKTFCHWKAFTPQ